MKCDNATGLMDDCIDGLLQLDQRGMLMEHVASCDSCRRELDELTVLRERLRNMPAKPPPAGFAENILRAARRDYTRRRAGMFAGAAAAAGLFLLIVAGLVRMTTDNSVQPAAIQMVEMNVLEQRTISLAFNSPTEIDDVTFILDLPEGVELSGHPDTQEMVWTDALSSGRNVLQLTLLGQKKMSGTLKASIEHEGRRREFSIPLLVREAGVSLPPAPDPVV